MLIRLSFCLAFVALSAQPSFAGNNRYYNQDPSYVCRYQQNSFNRSEWELQRREQSVEYFRGQLIYLQEMLENANSSEIDFQIENLQFEIDRLVSERQQLLDDICQSVPRCRTCNDYRRVQSRYSSAISSLQRQISNLHRKRNQSLGQLNNQIARAQSQLARSEQGLYRAQYSFEVASLRLSDCIASCASR